MNPLQRAEQLWQEGDLDAALEAYQQCIAIAPDHFDAHVLLGNRLKHLGRCAEALASFDAAGRLRPTEAGVHYNRALVLQSLGRDEEALAAFEIGRAHV